MRLCCHRAASFCHANHVTVLSVKPHVKMRQTSMPNDISHPKDVHQVNGDLQSHERPNFHRPGAIFMKKKLMTHWDGGRGQEPSTRGALWMGLPLETPRLSIDTQWSSRFYYISEAITLHLYCQYRLLSGGILTVCPTLLADLVLE
jgi:hypothetical protein